MGEAPDGTTAAVGPKPSLVWLKGQAPGVRHDGSSLVTMRLAEVMAEHFDLHLVCLATAHTQSDVAEHCCPPFTSVTVVQPDHQRSRVHRLVIGGWYALLDALSVRPLAASVESCRAMRVAARGAVARHGSDVVLAEYWTMGRALATTPGRERVLRLLDVEHENLAVRAAAAGGVRAAWLRMHARMVRRFELKVAGRADRVLFVSHEDEASFTALGMQRGETLPIAVTEVAPGPTDQHDPPRLVFLGTLGWWPNSEGLRRFVRESWPIVRAACPNVRLSVVGGGGDGLAGEFGDGVDLLGFVPDLDAALRSADVGIVPVSDGTGVKTKTLDLMAAGLPVVSTANGLRGTSGALAGAQVAEDGVAFAAAVMSLLQDETSRRTLAAAGLASVREYHSGAAGRRFAEALLGAHARNALQPGRTP